MLRTALCPLGQEEGAAGRGPELLPPPPAHLCANGHRQHSPAVLLLRPPRTQEHGPLLQAQPDSGEGSLPPGWAAAAIPGLSS